MAWFFGLICAAVVAGMGAAIYFDATSEKIELTKSEWHCTDTQTRVQLVGKTLIPRTTCIAYERI